EQHLPRIGPPAGLGAAAPVARSADRASPMNARTACDAAWRSAASVVRSRRRETRSVHVGRRSVLLVRWDSVRRDQEVPRAQQSCAQYAMNKILGKSILHKFSFYTA